MSSVGRPKTIGRLLSFDTYIDSGIEVIDHIERRRCQIETQSKVVPTSIPAEKFDFPVDRGVSITANSLILPHSVAINVRNHSGLMLRQLTSGDQQDFPYDQYSIELSTPIKLYFIINSDCSIEITENRVEIVLDGPTEVYIGARSRHEHPAGSVTTSSDPKEMMEAVSCLSSALKTTTCERSYPTLRGHPPEITLGDRLDIPEIIDKPQTGVRIEIPPEYESIYTVSPLAYYFGADLVQGGSPVIRTSYGFSYELTNSSNQFEKEIKRVLKQCFFLDCLTRTEGFYKVSLHERSEVEQELNIDFAKLYGQALSKQIEEYLKIPYDMIRSYIPKWKQTAYMKAAPEHVEILPFLAHDLAAIHTTGGTEIVRSDIKSRNIDNKPSGEVGKTKNKTPDSDQGGFVRGGGSLTHKETRSEGNSGENIEPEEYVQVPDDESLELTWIGDGMPLGMSKSMLRAYRNRLSRDPTESDIEVSVVVNDNDMMDEGVVADDVYGTREQLKFNVNIHRQLSVDELYDVFQRDIDFLHYIGHIDHGGFKCADGQLDITNINHVGIDSFFLNACSSYQQAIGLINAGSIAGIATIKPILNSGAERVGKTVAKLLNLGFPLITSLDISKSESIMGDNYVVIGDGGLSLTQPKGGIPSLCVVTRGSDKFNVTYKTYLTRGENIGSITIPHANGNEKFYLTSGITGEFSMGTDELLRFLSKENLPVKLDSKLCWSDEITVGELIG